MRLQERQVQSSEEAGWGLTPSTYLRPVSWATSKGSPCSHVYAHTLRVGRTRLQASLLFPRCPLKSTLLAPKDSSKDR